MSASSALKGIGVDAVDIERFRISLERTPSMRQRLFVAEELEYVSAKVDPVPKAGGRWNTMEIVANGSHFKVSLNGVVTVGDAQDSRFAEGVIALQSAGGIVKFRKLQIKPI